MADLYLGNSPVPYNLQSTLQLPPTQSIINLCINLEHVQFDISNGIYSSLQAQTMLQKVIGFC